MPPADAVAVRGAPLALRGVCARRCVRAEWVRASDGSRAAGGGRPGSGAQLDAAPARAKGAGTQTTRLARRRVPEERSAAQMKLVIAGVNDEGRCDVESPRDVADAEPPMMWRT